MNFHSELFGNGAGKPCDEYHAGAQRQRALGACVRPIGTARNCQLLGQRRRPCHGESGFRLRIGFLWLRTAQVQ